MANPALVSLTGISPTICEKSNEAEQTSREEQYEDFFAKKVFTT